MAKYAQGYERKNSDTKNLIILFSVIVGVILLTIGGVLLYNTFKKDNSYTYDKISTEYKVEIDDMESNGYYCTESDIGKASGANKLLILDDETYYMYIYSTSDSESMIKTVSDYITETEKENSTLPSLFIFSLPSSTTKLQEALGIKATPAAGMLIKVEVANGEAKIDERNIITKDAKDAIKNLMK